MCEMAAVFKERQQGVLVRHRLLVVTLWAFLLPTVVFLAVCAVQSQAQYLMRPLFDIFLCTSCCIFGGDACILAKQEG